jgi:hypothetical protein
MGIKIVWMPLIVAIGLVDTVNRSGLYWRASGDGFEEQRFPDPSNAQRLS